MSSLAAARADNFYYPPEWDPHGANNNRFQGNQHPLGKRAKNLGQGVLTIRFELPFSVWCEKCNSHCGRGVRYNADKKPGGKYFSTKIWEFSMRCHLCANIFCIATDPENRTYKCVRGCRQKVETYSSKDSEVIELLDEDQKKKLSSDAMYQLEYGEADKTKAKVEVPRIVSLEDLQSRMKDDYGMSQKLRKNFRDQKKVMKNLSEEAKAKGLFALSLLPEDEEDRVRASIVSFRSDTERSRQLKRLAVKTGSIFGPKSSATQSSGSVRKSSEAKEHEQKLRAAREAIERRIPTHLMKPLDPPKPREWAPEPVNEPLVPELAPRELRVARGELGEEDEHRRKRKRKKGDDNADGVVERVEEGGEKRRKEGEERSALGLSYLSDFDD